MQRLKQITMAFGIILGIFVSCIELTNALSADTPAGSWLGNFGASIMNKFSDTPNPTPAVKMEQPQRNQNPTRIPRVRPFHPEHGGYEFMPEHPAAQWHPEHFAPPPCYYP